jgi:hypothetical protein
VRKIDDTMSRQLPSTQFSDGWERVNLLERFPGSPQFSFISWDCVDA